MSKLICIDQATSETICPLPFMHTYITARGSASACCEAQEVALTSEKDFAKEGWNSRAYLELRKQMINGVRPKLCQKCWKNEDLGLASNRVDSWHHYLNGRWGEEPISVDDRGRVTRLPSFLEIKTSNVCNLKCRMCHPASSHRIREDREIIEQFRSLDWPEKVISSKETLRMLRTSDDFLENLKVVQFSGGEPLMCLEQIEFVRSLLNFHPEELELRYSTNLTMLDYKGVNYPELWSRFKKVNLKISADGVGDVYDYIRVGASFEKLDRNIRRLLEIGPPNIEINLGFTTQAYNVFQLPEVFAHFQRYMHPEAICFPLLHTPEMMSLKALPNGIKVKIESKLSQDEHKFEPVIQALKQCDFDSDLWDRLLSYTRKMEAKYSIETGFESLMMKYLEGY